VEKGRPLWKERKERTARRILERKKGKKKTEGKEEIRKKGERNESEKNQQEWKGRKALLGGKEERKVRKAKIEK
jgi:hypothetical protein